ncbi:uncharacterized protein LOC127859775 [Dreissena polymorpha]|uniref:uncharacterized protein LOC127859775 n=1 Tax=Dreissena polymorpha TaxID=45954 RepID=UPI00226548E1|nr:uncharacterized protein LOC127859775 [Dreissena polymorpha]
MWFPTDHRPPSTQVTPRKERRLPKLDRPGGVSGWSSDISKPSKASKTSKGSKDKVKTGNKAMSGAAVPTVSKPPTGETSRNGNHSTTDKPFFVEDERKSKITVISLKSNRTSRTVQTTQSSLTPRERSLFWSAPYFLHAGGLAVPLSPSLYRRDLWEATIKRIIASGLSAATWLLFLFGVFLPFWSVYTYTSVGVSTGYYGGLWNYCERSSTIGTRCTTFAEADLAHWFRAARGLELLAFLGSLGLVALVVAFMFFLREVKYAFIQWIIVGLCFGIAICSLTGMIVYGACEADSSRLSSAFGLTVCAFLGACAAGAIFLWDKIDQKNEPDPATMSFRGLSAIPSSHGNRDNGSRLSRVRSTRSMGQSQISHVPSTSTKIGASHLATVHQPSPPKEVEVKV